MTSVPELDQDRGRYTGGLAGLAGLEAVSEQLAGPIAVLSAEQGRRKAGVAVTRAAWKNLIFAGGPGAGKTRVAKAVARIYAELGLLSGDLREIAAAHLVGTTLQETGALVDEMARRAGGDLLMINDAHAWYGLPDHGRHLLRCLYKELTVSRDHSPNHSSGLAVILAGSEGPLRDMLRANPALAARFPAVIHFPGYLVKTMSDTISQHSRARRRPRADGERTRGAILRAAASLATVDGLAGLSMGNLAAAIGMSKSGLYAHFGSKQELQLATVEEAGRIFAEEVVQPALAAPPGLAQLAAVCEAFFDHLRRRTFPGGCFFASAALEMGTRPGPVKERVAAFQSGFVALVRGFAATAVEQKELPADEDPDLLAFELNGIILAADTNFVLHGDPAVLDLARQVTRRRLGLNRRENAGQG